MQKSGVGVIEGIAEGVIEGVRGVRLGVVVAVTVGTGVTLPQAPIKDKMRIRETTFKTRFRIVINRSISTSQYKFNC